MTKPQSWQCGGCKTWYAPFIEKCECERDSSEDESFVFSSRNGLYFRYIPIPYPVPMKEYWQPYNPYNPISPISLTYKASSTNNTSSIRLQP